MPSSLASRLDELILRFAELRGPRLAVELVEQRLGVERFEMARPARHEQEDDRLGLGRQMRRPWPRADSSAPAAGAASFVQQRRQRQAAEAAEGIAEELAARAGRA